ncbi:MAG: 2-oxoacid:ferredoxin oxidoreductase subunit gamma [Deltaproteobacteria bacterium]|nr:2-oxoacid:ferredoxin oxidoreductase subunit gamma [Deltaproteobacteria bacterium]MBM4322826.1 2-oxoacid:ferredoxin oxidoreductase subunit gamma [Deltaproteobacteria bacterium]
MTEVRQVRLSGLGGQGVVLAGLLLGQAGIFDGKYISGSNSYGAQARGSGCKSEIVLSEGPVDFPHLTTADILIAMSQGAYNTYYTDVREQSGLILYDQGFVIPKDDLRVKQLGIPATETSVKRLKNKQVSNIVFLGALIEATRIVTPKAIRKAIAMHVSERFRPLNFKALRVGMELGRQVHG